MNTETPWFRRAATSPASFVAASCSDSTGEDAHNVTNYDYATVAYSGMGIPLWTNLYNVGLSNHYNRAVAIAVDANGHVVVTGWSYTNTSAFFTNLNYYYTTIKYSGSGVPLWTNNAEFGGGLAIGHNGNVIVAGKLAHSSAGLLAWTNAGPHGSATVDSTGSFFVLSSYGDFNTVKHSPIIVPIRLAVERDGSDGFFIRITSAPDVTYRLQRAASVTGTWINLSTNTAPASGLIEFHDTSPLPGSAFYRAVQP